MVDNEFKKALSSKDFTAVRDMLRNRLFLDHDVTGGMFNEYWAECEKAGLVQNIFQDSDRTEISSEKSEENYRKLVGQLSKNFSRERLNAILSLAKSLWSQEQTGRSSETPQVSSKSENSSSNSRIVGQERIISECVLGEKEIDSDGEKSSYERRESFRGSNGGRNQDMHPKGKKDDTGMGVVVAVAAAAVVAIIAGVVIFG